MCCDPSPQAIEADREVLYAGALRSIMHQGDVSVQMDLADLKDRAHLYALGAVEDLKGEILILNGKPWISSVQDSTLSLISSFDKGAALFLDRSRSVEGLPCPRQRSDLCGSGAVCI